MYGGKDMKSSVDSHKRPFAQTFHCILILLLLVVTFIKSPHRHMRSVRPFLPQLYSQSHVAELLPLTMRPVFAISINS